MNYFAIVSALNGLLTLFAGFYLLVRNPKNPLYVSFAVFSGTASLWAIFYAIWQCQTSKEQALFFVRLTLIPCYFICFAFLWFVLTLVQHERRNYFLPLCVLTPLFFALFGFSNLTIPDVVPRMYLPYWPVPGPLMHLYVLIFFYSAWVQFLFTFPDLGQCKRNPSVATALGNPSFIMCLAGRLHELVFLVQHSDPAHSEYFCGGFLPYCCVCHHPPPALRYRYGHRGLPSRKISSDRNFGGEYQPRNKEPALYYSGKFGDLSPETGCKGGRCSERRGNHAPPD